MTSATRGRLALMAALVVCAGSAPGAGAAGINLYWNDCGAGSGATTNRNFACNMNTGANDLYVSFDPPAGIGSVVSTEIEVALQSSSPSVPNWWWYACRPLTLAFIPSAPSTCPDAWQGQGLVMTDYDFGPDPGFPPDRTNFIGFAHVPEGTTLPALTPGTEYLAAVLRIGNARTVGPDACAGCLTPVCLVLNRVGLTPSTGSPVTLFNALSDNFVGWQGGAGDGYSCSGATPALNRTWGQIKSVYR